MKLLSSFRRNSVAKKRFSNYVLYAIGEIVLVVIGILIALTVNNKNTGDKQLEKTKQTAALVIEQMQLDIDDISDVLSYWDEMQATIDTILVHTRSNEPIPSDCKGCFIILNEILVPTTSERVPIIIEKESFYEGKIKRKLNEIHLFYKQANKGNDFYEETIFEQIRENINYWKQNYSWFADYLNTGVCQDEACEAYFRESSDFRNRVAYLQFMALEAYYYNLDSFRQLIKTEREELISLVAE